MRQKQQMDGDTNGHEAPSSLLRRHGSSAVSQMPDQTKAAPAILHTAAPFSTQLPGWAGKVGRQGMVGRQGRVGRVG